MHLIFTAAFAAIVVYFAVTMARDFAREKGPLIERLLAAGKYSATKLWAKCVAIVGAGLGILASGSDLIGSPEVAQFIRDTMKPEYVSAALVAIAVVTQIARNRTL